MMEWRGSNGAGQVTLLDILDKVLDKGLVVAGDIRVSLANVELLTIKVRLLVCSIDKAQEIGLDWWRRDGFLSSGAAQETDALADRIEVLERRLAEAAMDAPEPRGRSGGRRSRPRRVSGGEEQTT